jgi:Na+/H+ antiporter NhaC
MAFQRLQIKIFRVGITGAPRKLVHIRRSIRAFGSSILGGAFENFEPGASWYNVTPLILLLYFISLVLYFTKKNTDTVTVSVTQLF